MIQWGRRPVVELQALSLLSLGVQQIGYESLWVVRNKLESSECCTEEITSST
uniref:Uncharacterized protein n=1 Tax=Rhizophora mucronata TaxID=61149 RepID=A0A2P2MTN9_RHIMU